MSIEDEKYLVAKAMTKKGEAGGFVRNLGEALSHADMRNTWRIKQAFPDYWKDYLARGKELYERGEI